MNRKQTSSRVRPIAGIALSVGLTASLAAMVALSGFACSSRKAATAGGSLGDVSGAPVPAPVTASRADKMMETEELSRAPASASVPMVKRESMKDKKSVAGTADEGAAAPAPEALASGNTESYKASPENPYRAAGVDPFSTFSIDVDTAAYTNARRYLTGGSLPPPDSVRVEEFVNYFDYDYALPKKGAFLAATETAVCPWNKDHRLLRVGIQGRNIEPGQLPPNNLVFLLDVSGSMSDENKLPLLKKSFSLLVDQLKPADTITIAVYAGAAGVVLPPTSAAKKDEIKKALGALNAGGSTAGGAGIELAYRLAKENFKKGGNNRVIIATDGDFNVGTTDSGSLLEYIKGYADNGIFLTVLGLGMGNYKDSFMEDLADKGNGNYAYIDTLNEAKKVFGVQLAGTLFTIAKDVKIQMEFNPALVKAYRLVGYENRVMSTADFKDDKKDAGELGAGHRVTALYEIVPATSAEDVKTAATGEAEQASQAKTAFSGDLAVLRIRYKEPKASESQELSFPVSAAAPEFAAASRDFRFASAVAALALKLKKSTYAADLGYDFILGTAKDAKGPDPFGYRQEFIDLATAAKGLDK